MCLGGGRRWLELREGCGVGGVCIIVFVYRCLGVS